MRLEHQKTTTIGAKVTSLTCVGKLFQTQAAVTRKAQW